jgi:hypothetical protein
VGLQSLGVDPEDEGDVRLNEASEKGHEKTVHRLLKDGADVNAKVGMMRRRYFCTAGCGHETSIAFLLLS